MKDFSKTLERVDGPRTKNHTVKVLMALTKELANLDIKIEVLGDTYATIKSDIEELS